MSSTITSKTITILLHLYATYGFLEQVVSDNGPQFTSEEFKVFPNVMVSNTSAVHLTTLPQFSSWAVYAES